MLGWQDNIVNIVASLEPGGAKGYIEVYVSYIWDKICFFVTIKKKNLFWCIVYRPTS